jgi:AraC-like DNA-binding protein
MHADIARRWMVDALAREAHMSRSAFAAAFKATTGDTPLGYLDSWRMYRAKALLRDTSLSLQQIANQIGYQTGTALSRAFARHHDVAPGAGRRHHQTNTPIAAREGMALPGGGNGSKADTTNALAKQGAESQSAAAQS